MAHLKPKVKKVLPKVPITTRLTPAEEAGFVFRPHTAPISEVARRVDDASITRKPDEKKNRSAGQMLRTVSMDSPYRPASQGNSATARECLRARTSSEIKLPVPERKCESICEDGVPTDSTAVGSLGESVFPVSERVPEPTEVIKKKKAKSPTGTSRGNSASSVRPISALNAEISRPTSAARPLSALIRPVSAAAHALSTRSPSGVRPHSAAETTSPTALSAKVVTPPPTGSQENPRPTSAELAEFNPLRPSVFAASLMSDHCALARRQSALATMDNFNEIFNVPEESRLTPVLEERPKSGIIPPHGSGVGNVRHNPSGHRHTPHGVKVEKVDSFRDSCGVSRLSSKSNSFSSLPSVEMAAPRMKQKAVSMRVFS